MTITGLPPAEDKPRGCYNCGESESACKCPAAPDRPDLDAWRAEAGACAPLDAAATRGPWRSTWGDDEAADAERGKRGEEVTIEAVGLEGLARIVLGVTWYDGPHPCCREEDAAFIEAARDGWPRDAARVGVLCAEVERLRAALLDALDVADSALCVATGVCAMSSDCAERDRLRALLSDDFIRLDPKQ